MKRNFLVKLFFSCIVCLCLFSCTTDDAESSPPTQETELPALKPGDPLLTNPR